MAKFDHRRLDRPPLLRAKSGADLVEGLLATVLLAMSVGCTSFATVRSAVVAPGLSANLQASVAANPGDLAGGFWSADCAQNCGHTMPSTDVGFAMGQRGIVPRARAVDRIPVRRRPRFDNPIELDRVRAGDADELRPSVRAGDEGVRYGGDWGNAKTTGGVGAVRSGDRRIWYVGVIATSQDESRRQT